MPYSSALITGNAVAYAAHLRRGWRLSVLYGIHAGYFSRDTIGKVLVAISLAAPTLEGLLRGSG